MPRDSSTGTPASANHRTDPPKRWVWSIVWGAATPCSSGGRSAVAAMNGTPLWWASTTAGCSSTAAVPLLVSTTAGRPLARPNPSAMKAALRSSWCTCTAILASEASATASGVDREPGQTTASVTPARAHSSTSVAQNVAAVVIAMDSYPAPVATIVLVHGFTQNRKCWGSILPALGRDHDVIAVDAPGHGQASDVRADLWQTSDLLATNGRATFVGYSMGARMALHVALSASRPRRWARLGQWDGRHRGSRPNARHESSATRRSRAHSSVTASTRSSLGGSTSRCSRRCRRALATTMPAARTPSTASRRASGSPAPARKIPCGIGSTSSRCPCSSSRAGSTSASPRRRTG